MRKLRIAFDLDETVNDLVYQTVQSSNAAYHQHLDYYSIDQYDIRPFLVPECENIWKHFCTNRFIRNLNVEPTAVSAISKIATTHDVCFLTAGFASTEKARRRWLSSHFDFFKPSMLIMEPNKQKWDGDILVDDYQNNLVGGAYVGVLMNRPWNQNFDEKRYGITRVNKVSDVLDVVARLERS